MMKNHKSIHGDVITVSVLVVLFFLLAGLGLMEGEAYGAVTLVDVSVSEQIRMVSDGKTPEMEVSDLIIENHSDTLTLNVECIEAVPAEDQWTLTAHSADFAKMRKNQNVYSLAAEGTEEHDFYQGKLILSDNEIEPLSSMAVKLEGKTGASTEAYTEVHVLDMIVTVSAVVRSKPELTVHYPASRDSESPDITMDASCVVSGRAWDELSEIKTVTVNGNEVSVDTDGNWAYTLSLEEDVLQPVTVMAVNQYGKSTIEVRYVKYTLNLPPEAFAVYSAADHSLRFYKNADYYGLEPGDTYEGNAVTAVYGGIETLCAESEQAVPWNTCAGDIQSITFEDAVTPVSTAFWFAGFYGCSEANMQNLDTSAVTDMSDMFQGCFRLEKVILGNAFSWVGDTGYLPVPSASYIEDADGLWYEENTNTGYLPAQIPANCAAVYFAYPHKTAFAVYSGDDNSLCFYKKKTEDNVVPQTGSTYNGKTATVVYTGFESVAYADYSDVPWYGNRTNIKSVIMVDRIKPVSTAYWFYQMRSCSRFDLTNLNTSSVKTMQWMFYQAGYNSAVTQMELIGLDRWDTSNVENMYFMMNYTAYYANRLELNLSDWDTSSLTDMTGLFSNLGRNAKTWSIGDLSDWDTSQVTSMRNVFFNTCYMAESWSVGNLGNWDTSKVTDMYGMFNGTAYRSLEFNPGDLSSWDTSKVTDMYAMFQQAGYNAGTWYVGDLSGWDTSKVETMVNMFRRAGYKADYSLDLSSWNVGKVSVYSNFNNGVEAKITAPAAFSS